MLLGGRVPPPPGARRAGGRAPGCPVAAPVSAGAHGVVGVGRGRHVAGGAVTAATAAAAAGARGSGLHGGAGGRASTGLGWAWSSGPATALSHRSSLAGGPLGQPAVVG